MAEQHWELPLFRSPQFCRPQRVVCPYYTVCKMSMENRSGQKNHTVTNMQIASISTGSD